MFPLALSLGPVVPHRRAHKDNTADLAGQEDGDGGGDDSHAVQEGAQRAKVNVACN
jgi:hypothetical protein